MDADYQCVRGVEKTDVRRSNAGRLSSRRRTSCVLMTDVRQFDDESTTVFLCKKLSSGLTLVCLSSRT